MVHFISSYGYLAIFVLMLAEAACIPVPSEITMLFGGALASGAVAGTNLDIIAVVAVGTAGNLIGSYAAWAVGRWLGAVRLKSWAHRLHLRERDVDRAQQWFERHGPASVFFGRLLPVVRTFISLPAGFAAMPAASFGAYTFAGCLIWTTVLGAVGFAIGSNWTSVANAFHGPTYVIAGLLVIAFFGWLLLARRRRSAGTDSAGDF